MEKFKAIPEGYMTVGEVAKRLNTTVRTLQYYDKEGLMKPSMESEGGRRLYSDKDIVKLHQILTLKRLGFSLDDIKNRLIAMDTPEQIGEILNEQIEVIENRIKQLTQSLKETKILRDEVVQMKTVDFKRYADIMISLEMKIDSYWMIKHFDDDTMEYCRTHFTEETAKETINQFNKLSKQAIQLMDQGITPQSPEGMAYAKDFWDCVMKFTGGDMTILQKLIDLYDVGGSDEKWKEMQDKVNGFVGPALGAYFDSINQNPIEGMDIPEKIQEM